MIMTFLSLSLSPSSGFWALDGLGSPTRTRTFIRSPAQFLFFEKEKSESPPFAGRERVERKSAAMASSSSSGLTFKLHPLVIVNISDHYTRVKSQMHPPHNAVNGSDRVDTTSASSPSPSSPPRVYGCVIGIQRGRTVEIFNSFELLYDPSTHSLDRAFLEKKQELCSSSFSFPLALSFFV